jgi:hypothetical protein
MKPAEVSGETLNMKALCYSETSGCLLITRRYNPKDSTLHSHRRENLEPNSFFCFLAHFPYFEKIKLDL